MRRTARTLTEITTGGHGRLLPSRRIPMLNFEFCSPTKFVFGKDWGNDVISQLDGGTITLYFEGSDIWFDEISQVYTDGVNTLKINGSATVISGDINTL